MRISLCRLHHPAVESCPWRPENVCIIVYFFVLILFSPDSLLGHDEFEHLNTNTAVPQTARPVLSALIYFFIYVQHHIKI